MPSDMVLGDKGTVPTGTPTKADQSRAVPTMSPNTTRLVELQHPSNWECLPRVACMYPDVPQTPETLPAEPGGLAGYSGYSQF